MDTKPLNEVDELIARLPFTVKRQVLGLAKEDLKFAEIRRVALEKMVGVLLLVLVLMLTIGCIGVVDNQKVWRTLEVIVTVAFIISAIRFKLTPDTSPLHSNKYAVERGLALVKKSSYARLWVAHALKSREELAVADLLVMVALSKLEDEDNASSENKVTYEQLLNKAKES